MRADRLCAPDCSQPAGASTGSATRWSVLLLGALSDGPAAFTGAAARRVDGISQKMLDPDPPRTGARRDGQPDRPRDRAGGGSTTS